MTKPRNEKLISWSDFQALDIRAGTILEVMPFPEARKPAYRLAVDFGELGVLKSSAQITALYTPDHLVGRQVVAVVNFPAKQIANHTSECLVLGVYNEEGQVVLLSPLQPVENGSVVG
jgi:tRNA-binding protein